MPLTVGCPRCAAPVAPTEAGYVCVEHGEITPLWRPRTVAYEDFAEHLQTTPGCPTYLPWPLSPGWSIADFAGVAAPGAPARATMTCTSGTSALDGPVDVIVVAEEPGTGLGSRLAGLDAPDPGADVGVGPALVRVRIDRQVVPLWSVSVSDTAGEWDRSVLAGEAAGRWLWLIVRPASAMLLLRDDWILRDASGDGPHLVELPFGGPAPTW
ncbi:DUF6758 family protein [Nocardioides sp.]|uniref:DUF6758 family protein n=1 Tax=Nocardioides sp. TaxID=35761 RepID=UPI00351395DA